MGCSSENKGGCVCKHRDHQRLGLCGKGRGGRGWAPVATVCVGVLNPPSLLLLSPASTCCAVCAAPAPVLCQVGVPPAFLAVHGELEVGGCGGVGRLRCVHVGVFGGCGGHACMCMRAPVHTLHACVCWRQPLGAGLCPSAQQSPHPTPRLTAAVAPCTMPRQRSHVSHTSTPHCTAQVGYRITVAGRDGKLYHIR